MKRNMASGQSVMYSIFSGGKLTQNDVSAITNYANAVKGGVKPLQAYKDNLGGCSVAAKRYVVDAKKAGKSTDEMVAGLKEVPKATSAASIGLKALSIAGNMLMMMGISLAIKGIIKGFDALITTTEEHQEQLQNLQQEYDEAKQNLEDVNSQITEYENKIKELEGKTLTPVEEEELQRIKNLNEQLKIEKEVLEEIERIKKGETSDKAIKTINSKKGGMTRIEMVEDYARKGYVNTQREIDQIMASDYMTSEEKNYEIKFLREHQDKLRQQALEITSELLDESKALDQNDAEAKELYDKIQALSAETLTWAKDVDAATNSVNENSNATSNASENADEMKTTLSDLEKSSEKIKTLGSAFRELSDDGYITTKTLGEIQTATGLSVDEWKEYEDKLLNAEKGSAEFNRVMGELTYAMLENQLGTEKLANANEGYIAAILRENGVLNANSVAHDMVEKAKIANQIKTIDLANAIEDGSIIALKNEALQCGYTESAFWSLVAQEKIFNNTALDVTQQISALKSLEIQAGITKGALSGLSGGNSVGDKLNDALALGVSVNDKGNIEFNGKDYGKGEDAYNQAIADASAFAFQKDLEEKYKNTEVDFTIPNYSGNISDSSSDKTPFDDSYYSTLDAWINEGKKQIETLEKERESLNRQFENALDTGNKEQAEILRAKLAENAKKQKDILHQENEAHRITQGNLLQSLYQYAPSLEGKSWDEISEVDLVNIENELNNKAELASDNDKNQAKYKLNQFKGIVDDLKSLNDVIEDNSQSWLDADDYAKSYWQSQIDFQDEYSNTWIENQKAFDRLSEEEELAAYDRMINNNKEFQKQILNDVSLSEDSKLALIKETNDKIVEIEKNTYDLRKEIFDKASDFGSSYLDSRKTLLEAYYDVTNSIAEAQHEINKELETSMSMYEYLDETTRQLLFNQEDYNILTDELYDIEYKAGRLKRQYERDLNNATLETIESITSNYEMQYELLMKSYEVAKADLEITKKKQQLNNVLNERNVRMFINGQWQWVANTEDVAKAKSELADAEYAKRVEEAGLTQQESINNLTKQQDELGVVIKQFENGVIDLDTATRKISSTFDELPSEIQNAISRIGGTSYSGSSYSGSSGSYGVSDADFVAGIKAQMAANSVGWHGASESEKKHLEKANQELGAIIGSTYDSATGTWKHKHANGTRYTPGGATLMGEDGDEMFINSSGRLIPINQPTFGNISAGGIVFNKEQMSNLRSLWDLSNISRYNHSNIVNGQTSKSVVETHDNRIIINGMTISEQGNEDWIDGFKRYIATHKH